MYFVPRIVLSALLLTSTATALAATDFSACPQFFAKSQPPKVTQNPTNRALCYDAFAILHSGQSKTAVFVAQKLNRASIADADEKRKDKFFSDARLPEAERATLEDYRKSGWSRGSHGSCWRHANGTSHGAELFTCEHGSSSGQTQWGCLGKDG
jgi:DNA/RNA endonuclease G (NUC1)